MTRYSTELPAWPGLIAYGVEVSGWDLLMYCWGWTWEEALVSWRCSGREVDGGAVAGLSWVPLRMSSTRSTSPALFTVVDPMALHEYVAWRRRALVDGSWDPAYPGRVIVQP